MWGISCSMYNLKHLKRGLQVPLTLLSHAQSEVEWRLGSRSARGCAAELGLFLLPWHCRLAPSSICSFGTYSCNDYEQSLIKLQRTNQGISVWVYGDDHLLVFFSVCGWVCATHMSSAAEVCKFVCVCLFACVSLLCVLLFLKSVQYVLLVCMHVCVWLGHTPTVSLTPSGCQRPYC